MNRRDYFAAAALQGLLAHGACEGLHGCDLGRAGVMAFEAAAYADALIEVLDKSSPAPVDRKEGPPAPLKAAGAGGVYSQGGAHGEGIEGSVSAEKEGGAAAHGGAPDPCRRCDGSGKIADTPTGEPWTAWAELPPGSDIAVRAGIVKPIECPACHGTKVAP